MADEAYYKDIDAIGKARDGIKKHLETLQVLVDEYRASDIPTAIRFLNTMDDKGLLVEQDENVRLMKANIADVQKMAINAQRVFEDLARAAAIAKQDLDAARHLTRTNRI